MFKIMPVILYLVLNILVCVYDSEGASVGALGPAEFDSEGWKGTIPPPYPPFKEEDVKFQLFTRDPKSGEFLDFKDDSTIINSPLNASNPTKIATHGWKDDGNAPYLQGFKNMLLESGDFNFIEVDWQLCAKRDYLDSIDCLMEVGNAIGKMIMKIVKLKKVSYDDVHVIGHSLGGQLVGLVSKIVGRKKIGRITALDPASPKFENKGPKDSLDSSDAQIVDVIVTGLDNFGLKKIVGTINFYPNANMDFQPGCNQIDSIANDCNHHASVLYFIDTVTKSNRKKYIATKCSSIENLRNGNCNGEKGVLGLDLFQTTPGIYYIRIPEQPNLGF